MSSFIDIQIAGLERELDARRAVKEGKAVQFRWKGDREWRNVPSPPAWCDGAEYRRKPVPTVRRWSKPEHVPGPVCWLRPKFNRTWEAMIVQVNVLRIAAAVRTNDALDSVPWEELESYEYSTDRKTWHPCEVIEGEA